MAGGWIRMRVDLARDPKVVAIADHLAYTPEFRAWLAGTGAAAGAAAERDIERDMSVTRRVTTRVSVAGLLLVWGTAREQGRRVRDDLVIDGIDASVVDEIAGVPGFGAAMAAAGWLDDADAGRVVFPKFFEQNADTDEMKRRQASERKRRERERRQRDGERDTSVTVTPMSRVTERDTSVTGSVTVTPMSRLEKEEEKEREKKEEEHPLPPRGRGAKSRPADVPVPPALDTPDFRRAWAAWLSDRVERKKPLTARAADLQLRKLAPVGPAAAVAAIEKAIASGWQGIYPEGGGQRPAGGGPRTKGQAQDAYAVGVLFGELNREGTDGGGF